MNLFWIGFITGLFVGASIGCMAMALMVMAKKADVKLKRNGFIGLCLDEYNEVICLDCPMRESCLRLKEKENE